jgi:hypothetical protein
MERRPAHPWRPAVDAVAGEVADHGQRPHGGNLTSAGRRPPANECERPSHDVPVHVARPRADDVRAPRSCCELGPEAEPAVAHEEGCRLAGRHDPDAVEDGVSHADHRAGPTDEAATPRNAGEGQSLASVSSTSIASLRDARGRCGDRQRRGSSVCAPTRLQPRPFSRRLGHPRWSCRLGRDSDRHARARDLRGNGVATPACRLKAGRDSLDGRRRHLTA